MNTKTIMIIALVAILAFGLGFGIYLFSQKRAPVPTNPIQITPTNTPIPSATPESTPSSTVAPTSTIKTTPTNTPKPLTTPTPTLTPTPTPTPGVINIETSVSPSGTTHNCSTQTFTFTAKIYTNAATTVTYKWLRSDGAGAPTETLTFTSASMQTVTDTWSRGQASGTQYTGWERVEILTPNSTLGNQAEFTQACP